jgi:two-component system response regulator FixJ
MTHRIAIVDDNNTIRQSFTMVLEYAGYGVTEYASGQEFLDSGPRKRVDCVVLDLEMPGMNGIEVLGRLRDKDSTTPVLIVTGTQDLLLLEVAQKSDVSAVLKKPIGPEALISAVASAVSKASLNN